MSASEHVRFRQVLLYTFFIFLFSRRTIQAMEWNYYNTKSGAIPGTSGSKMGNNDTTSPPQRSRNPASAPTKCKDRCLSYCGCSYEKRWSISSTRPWQQEVSQSRDQLQADMHRKRKLEKMQTTLLQCRRTWINDIDNVCQIFIKFNVMKVTYSKIVYVILDIL